MFYRGIFFTITFFFIITSSVAQVTGRIFDNANNLPLQGVAILNLNDSTGTTSDNFGRFSLAIQSYPIEVLISHLGYEPQIITIEKSLNLTIALRGSEFHLNEIVVNATQFNSRLVDVPTAVQAISREEIQRNDETFVAPILNRIPGLFMESGSLNTNRIAIRGIGSRTPFATNRVRVYFDDIPLTTGEGESTLEDIDINTLERIEVIRGPASGIYGAGLGGTINMLSAAPGGASTTLRTKYITGSYGLRNFQMNFSNSSENGSFNVALNDLNNDGYRENSEYSRRSAIVSGRFAGGEKLMISVLGSFIDLNAEIPSSLDRATFLESPTSAAASWNAAEGYESYQKGLGGVSFQYSLTDHLTLHSSGFLSFRDAYEPRPFNILDEETVATGFRTRLQYLWITDKQSTTFQAGTEIFTDWYNWSTYDNRYEQFPGQGSVLGEILSDNSEQRSYENYFFHVRHEREKWIIEGGFNFNVTEYQLLDKYFDGDNQSGSYDFDEVFSPRLGLIYRAGAHWNIFATVSHGFSMPSLEETLTPEGRINTSILPETGFNYEGGIKGHWLNQRLAGELTIYHTDIENLLVAERVGPDQYVGLNAGKTTHNGLEALLRYRQNINKNLVINPFLSVTLADYKFNQFVSRDIDYGGNQISGFPGEIVNIGFDIRSAAGYYFISDFRYVGEAFLNDENTLTNSSYDVINVKAGFQKDFRSGLFIDINFGVNNLLDEKYASMILVNAVGFGGSDPRYFYPGLPRNYYGGVSLGVSF